MCIVYLQHFTPFEVFVDNLKDLKAPLFYLFSPFPRLRLGSCECVHLARAGSSNLPDFDSSAARAAPGGPRRVPDIYCVDISGYLHRVCTCALPLPATAHAHN